MSQASSITSSPPAASSAASSPPSGPRPGMRSGIRIRESAAESAVREPTRKIRSVHEPSAAIWRWRIDRPPSRSWLLSRPSSRRARPPARIAALVIRVDLSRGMTMRENGVGRVVVASLHQAIGEVLPTRLSFYENWLNADGLRDGRIGLAPLYAVLSFLRQEKEGYGL